MMSLTRAFFFFWAVQRENETSYHKYAFHCDLNQNDSILG